MGIYAESEDVMTVNLLNSRVELGTRRIASLRIVGNSCLKASSDLSQFLPLEPLSGGETGETGAGSRRGA